MDKFYAVITNADIAGDVNFTGDLYIDALVKGNIIASNACPSTLVLGPKAKIQGDIFADNITVNGYIPRQFKYSGRCGSW